jgi:hypothetical protein
MGTRRNPQGEAGPMTNEELQSILDGKSEEWRAGFFAAINLNVAMKAAFLRGMIGEAVEVVEAPSPLCRKGRYCGQSEGHEGECDDIPF